ncbi:MAG TPA: ester cyclase [Candidatus Limnocylindria bacterium]|nr:ester cyclase [Candidatus Limnocylindria bacterium]
MTAFEDLAKKWTDAYNRHDPRAVAAYYTQDTVSHDPFYPEPLKGRAAIEKDAADFFRAFPDLRVEVINIFEKGDRAAGEIKMTGTNNGPLATPTGEVPATGKRMDLRVAFVGRINAENLIVEERRYYDTGTLMQQLGLAPEAAEAAEAVAAR